jgi:hypothetical protein
VTNNVIYDDERRAAMETYTWAAIDSGLSLKQTIAAVKRRMKKIDERFIREIYEEYAQ